MGFRSVVQSELFTLSKEDLDEFTLLNPEGHQELLRRAFESCKAILRARRLSMRHLTPPREDTVPFEDVGARRRPHGPRVPLRPRSVARSR